MALTQEGENFVRFAKIILEVVPTNLRSFFESKWNIKYPLNKWDDTQTSGLFLMNEIKRRPSGILSSQMKEKLKAGDKNQWDSTTLFFVLLGRLGIIPTMRLFPQRSPPLLVSEEIDKLRLIRNESFAHISAASITNADYHQTVIEIENIFTNLGWMQGLQEIQLIKTRAVSTLQMQVLKEKFKAEKKKNDDFLAIRREFQMLKRWVTFGELGTIYGF